jgi:hypothetical protein
LTAPRSYLVGLHLLTRGGHGLHPGEWHREPYAVMLVRGEALPSSFTPFRYRIFAFSLSSLVSWL